MSYGTPTSGTISHRCAPLESWPTTCLSDVPASSGRAEDRATLARLLDTTGLVTVVGPGGVGKTRLALQVAFDVLDEFEDGAWLVELAALADPASVPRAVASAMGIAEVPGKSTEEVLASALGSKAALLILDNCEHLLDAIAGLAQMLSERCPNLVILSTSREPLDIDGEVVWRVEPLLTLDPDQTVGIADLKASDAVQLFTERAASVRPGFELTEDNAGDIARIVFHLSGMPLAIELAAAALAERSLSGVLSGLEDRFSLLVRGRRTAPTRHQTLRAAIEWSLDLLDPSERLLFDRLSVFAGSGTNAAAGEVCGGGVVESSEVPELMRSSGQGIVGLDRALNRQIVGSCSSRFGNWACWSWPRRAERKNSPVATGPGR